MTDRPSTGTPDPRPSSPPGFSTDPLTDAQPSAPAAYAGLTRLSDHWGLLLTYGLLTMAMGIILVTWPESTLVVFAVLLAVQFIVSGVFRIVTAVAASALDGGMRALVGLSGALAVLVGLLCLRSPLQTLTAVGMLIGIWWVISGLVDIISAMLSTESGRRAWEVLLGVVSLVAGAYLLVNPKISLAALVVVATAWLFGYGFIVIVAALRLRSTRKPTQTAFQSRPVQP